MRRCLTENAERGKREVTDNAPLTQSPDGAGYPGWRRRLLPREPTAIAPPEGQMTHGYYYPNV